MEDPDMMQSFENGEEIVLDEQFRRCLQRREISFNLAAPKTSRQAVEWLERITQGSFTQPWTRRVDKVNESAWIFAKKYPKHVEGRTKASPTQDSFTEYLPRRWERIAFDQETPLHDETFILFFLPPREVGLQKGFSERVK